MSVALASVAAWSLVFASPTATRQSSIVGRWAGKVTAPQGETEIGFEFTATSSGVAAKLHMPMMHAYGVDLGAIELDGGRVTIAVLDTELEPSGETLRGRFGLGRLPIELARGGTPGVGAFAPEPAAPTYARGPEAAWTYELGAPSWSSPLVDGGVVYVGASDGALHAVRAADGACAWTWRGSHRLDGLPVATEDAIHAVDERGDLVRVDRASGELIWRVALHDAKAHGPAPSNPTYNRRTAYPAIEGGALYVGSSDGGVLALDAATGERRWRIDAGAPIHGGATLHGEHLVSVGCMSGDVLTLDRRDGRLVARARAGGAVVTAPLVLDERVIVGSRDYLLYGFDLEGELAWRYSYWFSWVESTPRIRDGAIYVGSSDLRRVTALDPSNGRAHWATDVRGMAWGSPAVTASSVYVGTVAQSGTILRHEGAIVALDRSSGALRWRRVVEPPDGAAIWGFAGSLAHDGERLFCAGLDGSLIALPAR